MVRLKWRARAGERACKSLVRILVRILVQISVGLSLHGWQRLSRVWLLRVCVFVLKCMCFSIGPDWRWEGAKGRSLDKSLKKLRRDKRTRRQISTQLRLAKTIRILVHSAQSKITHEITLGLLFHWRERQTSTCKIASSISQQIEIYERTQLGCQRRVILKRRLYRADARVPLEIL